MTSKKSEESLERRARERAAPRLTALIPSLTSLRIAVQEQSGMGSVTYQKHVMVGSAPALFVLNCGDERCQDGGHDITNVVMSSLRARETLVKGEHACDGRTGTASCTRRITFEVVATYELVN